MTTPIPDDDLATKRYLTEVLSRPGVQSVTVKVVCETEGAGKTELRQTFSTELAKATR